MVATLTPSAHHPHTHSHKHHSNGHHSHQEHRRPSIQHATTHSAVAQTDKGVPETPSEAKGQNRVLVVLMRRLGASKTFGENMIFMLNRAGKFLVLISPSADLCADHLHNRSLDRKHSRRPLSSAAHPQDPVLALYNPGHIRVLLHERSQGSRGRVHQSALGPA